MKIPSKSARRRGFALIVTLSLMILLTVVAVGLLTLSSISLRTTGRGQSLAEARSNARMALLLAVGELQKSAGPDQRITAPASLIDKANPPGVTGVWKSWKPAGEGTSDSDYRSRKTGDHFLGYLVSNPQPAEAPDPAAPPTGGAMTRLVDKGTLGTAFASQKLEAPTVLTRRGGAQPDGAFAWAVLDEGVKARIDLLPELEAKSLGEEIARIGSPARNRFAKVKGLEFIEDADTDDLLKQLPKLVSLRQAELGSESPKDLSGNFHDLTVASASLQTNVADGGLKTDLSVLFEGSYGDNLPREWSRNYLYSNTNTPFPDTSSNADPLWSVYANYARLYRLSSAAEGSALTGLKAKRPAGYMLRPVSDRSASPPVTRYEPYLRSMREPLLMPTVLRVDVVFSLVVHQAHQGRGTASHPNQLHMMYLPVITLHNPYNVPLRCANLSVEFSDVPIGFQFLVNGQPANNDGLMALNQLYTRPPAGGKTFSVTLSNSLSRNEEVVMGPGETRIFGTPFDPGTTWSAELAANGDTNRGGRMFDWQSNMTNRPDSRLAPGLITGPNDGIGFDVDWLAPREGNRAAWLKSRRNDGVILINDSDNISVRFGPSLPASNSSALAITTRMDGSDVGKTQVIYKNQTTLTSVLSEGVSPRYPEPRSFPATFPPAGASGVTGRSLFEGNSTKFKDYVNAKPFAIFTVAAKTTIDSFTKSRPLTDTGLAFPMATCDFRTSASQGSSPMEFALIPLRNNGSGGIESGGPNSNMGFFFGGNGSFTGTTAATIYEIPLAPLQSIAQLRNANTASLGGPNMTTYSVGESRAHPALPSHASFLRQDSAKLLMDHSWLANSTLWDGYWFSTLSSLEGPAWTGSAAKSQSKLAEEFFAGQTRLPNPRNIAYTAGAAGNAKVSATAALANDGADAAAHILTRGGFNVNSTSVAAWRAVLSSLSKSRVPLVQGSAEDADGTPFPRVRRPVHGAASADVTPVEKLWNSYRLLDETQIDTLARNIVEEVRLRGPFLSMAEFVNRRLGSPGELTRTGALQAAIDKTGVNESMLANARSIAPAEVKAYGWENPDAVTGNTGTGSPGEISQGDVLSAIGSFITVRSDTFRIRAYGDARDRNGKVTARAWCEATVQRVPDFLDPSDAATAPATADANVRFGRQFKVIAFRWLSADEV